MKQNKENTIRAFKIAKQNAYMKYNSDEEVMFYIFMQGMIFERTGKFPESFLNNI